MRKALVACSIGLLAACGGGGTGTGGGGGAVGGGGGGSVGGGGGSVGGGGGAVGGGGGAVGGGGGSVGGGGGGAVGGGGGCQPACAGRACGSDGCGGTCGACTVTQQCVNGRCECLPESDAAFCQRAQRACDSLTAMDNCGVTRTVSCGSCQAPQTCGGAGVPGQCGCTPQCAGKACGPDGCGGQCGTCPANSACAANQLQCDCINGTWPNPQGTACVALGSAVGPAQGYPINGYCVGGRYWMVPDQQHGLQVWDCAPGICRPDGNGGLSGSCTCGSPGTGLPSLGLEGFCLPQSGLPAGFADREVLFTCFAGNVYYENCKARTGQVTGVCQTLISSFGNQSNCYCNVCVRYDLGSRQCLPACYGSLPTCATGPGGAYSCYP